MTAREEALANYISLLIADGELKRSGSIAEWLNKIPVCVAKDIVAVAEMVGRSAAERILGMAGKFTNDIFSGVGNAFGAQLMEFAKKIGPENNKKPGSVKVPRK